MQMGAFNEGDERGASHDLVRQRIHQDAEVRDQIPRTRNPAIQKICDPRQAEEKQRQRIPEWDRRRPEKQPKKNHRQHKTRGGEFVWQVHANGFILILILVHQVEDEAEAGDAKRFYAPNLSNIFAFACIWRIRNLESNTPSEPLFAPVSVKRSSLSEPLTAECSNTGCGCQEWPFIKQGVEWSPVTTSTSGFFFNRIGSAASKSSIAFFLAAKFPSSPALSVYL